MRKLIFLTFLIWGRGRDPNPSRPGTQGTGMQNRQIVPGWKGMGIEIENSSRDRDPFFRPVPSLAHPWFQPGMDRDASQTRFWVPVPKSLTRLASRPKIVCPRAFYRFWVPSQCVSSRNPSLVANDNPKTD